MTINNSALLLIEFQYEWMHPDGKLNPLFKDLEQFKLSKRQAERVLQAARLNRIHKIHSGLGFQAGYPELGQAKQGLRAEIPKYQSFEIHSEGSQFYPPFVPLKHEFIVQGRLGASAFSGSNLDSYLRYHHIQCLYIIGYALHVCVESTLRAAHDLGYETFIIEDACSAFTKEQKTHFSQEILPHFGASIYSEDFIQMIHQSEAIA